MTTSEPQLKICARCKTPKLYDAFYTRPANPKQKRKGGHPDSYCRPCRTALNDEQYHKNVDVTKERKRNDYHRWIKNPEWYVKDRARRYGVPLEFMQEVLNRNACDICHVGPGIKGRLVIDHCHERNVLRGLLCDLCNHMLGHAKDNADTLRKAADYIDYFNANHGPRCRPARHCQ